MPWRRRAQCYAIHAGVDRVGGTWNSRRRRAHRALGRRGLAWVATRYRYRWCRAGSPTHKGRIRRSAGTRPRSRQERAGAVSGHRHWPAARSAARGRPSGSPALAGTLAHIGGNRPRERFIAVTVHRLGCGKAVDAFQNPGGCQGRKRLAGALMDGGPAERIRTGAGAGLAWGSLSDLTHNRIMGGVIGDSKGRCPGIAPLATDRMTDRQGFGLASGSVPVRRGSSSTTSPSSSAPVCRKPARR